MERIGIEHVGHSCNKIQIIRVSKEKVACPGQSRYKALERGHCANRKIISLPPGGSKQCKQCTQEPTPVAPPRD